VPESQLYSESLLSFTDNTTAIVGTDATILYSAYSLCVQYRTVQSETDVMIRTRTYLYSTHNRTAPTVPVCNNHLLGYLISLTSC